MLRRVAPPCHGGADGPSRAARPHREPHVRQSDVRATTRQRVGGGPVEPRAATTLSPMGYHDVRLTSGFLARLQHENATTSIVRGQEHLDRQQAWTNFENAAAGSHGEPYHGPVFEDGEAFKWLEATAWEHGRGVGRSSGTGSTGTSRSSPRPRTRTAISRRSTRSPVSAGATSGSPTTTRSSTWRR